MDQPSIGLCLYCTFPDNYIQACPVKPPRPAVSTLQTDPIIAKLTVLNVQLLTSVQYIAASALVDLGSSGNFISQNLTDRLHLPRQRHAQELRIKTINGKPFECGCVRFETPPLKLFGSGACMRRRSYFSY